MVVGRRGWAWLVVSGQWSEGRGPVAGLSLINRWHDGAFRGSRSDSCHRCVRAEGYIQDLNGAADDGKGKGMEEGTMLLRPPGPSFGLDLWGGHA